MSERGKPRGRYAPSPTGALHLGNASTALLAWLAARARGGALVIRMEDLDRPRVRPGAAARILGDLAWLGLDWDEGPDRGGPHAPYEQWARRDRYDEAFAKLFEARRVYPCFCSRKDIASAASAPQTPGEEARYPGTCRGLGAGEIGRRVERGKPHAWRFRVEPDDDWAFEDRVCGPQGGAQAPPGDFVVRRADAVPAYQLAVVVDDAAMGITEVVRGQDLLASTFRQVLLYRALGLEPPSFAHVPLLLGPDGVRLSKRHQGTAIEEMRDAGLGPEAVVGLLARLLGLASEPTPRGAESLIEGFEIERLRGCPPEIRVDPIAWMRS